MQNMVSLKIFFSRQQFEALKSEGQLTSIAKKDSPAKLQAVRLSRAVNRDENTTSLYHAQNGPSIQKTPVCSDL